MDIRYPLLDRDYQVKLEMFDKRAKCPDTKLTYRMHVHPESMMFGSNSTLLFQRSDVNLNDTEVHDPLSEMTLAGQEILQQLKLEMTRHGEIAWIRNMEELQKRWKDNIRFRREDAYTGELAEALLSRMDRQMNDEKLLILSLQRDPFILFYTCLFNEKAGQLPIYWLAGFPVRFDREEQCNSACTRAELVLTLADDQQKLLRDYYTPIYGEGAFMVNADLKYTLTDHSMSGMQAQFEINWNELPVKRFSMEIESLKAEQAL